MDQVRSKKFNETQLYIWHGNRSPTISQRPSTQGTCSQGVGSRDVEDVEGVARSDSKLPGGESCCAVIKATTEIHCLDIHSLGGVKVYVHRSCPLLLVIV